VTWNKKDLVQRCIESILENTHYPNYKILVHSNGCEDGTQEYLEKLAKENPKVVPILSPTNEVFVKPNNDMMQMFAGNDAVLVNNDVTVKEHWLTALHRAAYSSEKIGIAGAKTLYPDGRLQEFGSELYEGGTGMNIGKFDDPGKPEYSEMKKVGYVSGCMMYIKQSTMQKIGHFDEQFHPCYCEDSDYCYTAWENDIETVVTPECEVIHDEGGTSGTDTSSGFKSYQVVNMKKFIDKHRGKNNGISWSENKETATTLS
jgi:GT2 family glycosyltransferase